MENNNSEPNKTINTGHIEAGNLAYGDFNQEITTENYAAGDIYQSNYQQNPSFLEVDISKDIDYPSPTFLAETAESLEKKRIAIFKGNNHFDLSNFGKQLAKKLTKKHPHHITIELVENEENKSLLDQLDQRSEFRIVLLNAIHPRHIQYDFDKLINTCEKKKSFYIILTDSSRDTWLKSGKASLDFWHQIPEKDQYDQTELSEWFLRKLDSNRPAFIPEDDEITGKTLFSSTLNVNEIISQISTPQKLTVFLATSRNRTELFSDRRLNETLQNLNKGTDEIITRWFNNLEHSQKVIAISAALFNGVFSNQYFEILTEMSKSSFWNRSTRIISSLDYYNIDFLHTFFRYESTDEGDLLVARNPTIRTSIIRAAIDHYPRHIDKALTIFMDVMKSSYNRKIGNWELHGTNQRRALIRQVFIEATRDIGISLLGNIESVYLQLASTGNHYIQGVAAKSIAQYRLLDNDKLLFETIEKWLTNKTIQDRIDLFLREKPENKQQTISTIKTTTIRILAYAADYDQPNQLHEKIVEYLISYSGDNDTYVQKTFASVLPKFIHHHTNQLRNQIFDHLMINPAYESAISDGLMMAYRDYPTTLKEVIVHWLLICKKEVSKENRRHKTTHRDNRLITILETLKKITLNEDEGFTVQELYKISIHLLKQEQRPQLVDRILFLITELQSFNYDLAYDYVGEILTSISPKQRKLLTQLWVVHYMKQRELLPNSEFTITMNGIEYPAWEDPDNRPLTKIEEALFKWLNSSLKPAQEFATLTFLELAHSFESDEYELIRAYRAQKQQQVLEQESNRRLSAIIKKSSATPNYSGLDFWLKLRIFFYLLFESKMTKEKLTYIILIFQSAKYSKHDLRLVIHKWEVRKRGDLTTKLAKWLKKLFNNIKN